MLNSVKLLCFIIFLGFLSSFSSISNDTKLLKKNSQKINVICLDAGHGGKDPGCHGKNSHESKIALKLVLAFGQLIESNYPEIKVIYTRKKDVFVDLHERSAIANRKNADLFISVHCNSHPSSKFQGSETFTMGLHKTNSNLDVAKRENSVILQETDYQKNYKGFDPKSPMGHITLSNFQNIYMANSIKLAQKIERQFKKQTARTSYGVKQAGFLVLWETSMPSVLVESGFLTNRTDENYLSSEKGQNEIAESLFKAFKQYKEEIE
ncbi:MAG: N-acetylmuramoyl-L-alanine amidase [Pseudarcicella sp.]|nr:N-acetylmuramoyl-L-alanine amidase [Pseudarcicella sp.]MBP6411427.1 N-acetylmuramoyl-L-alanine amidase [Pseudarcicella sp.]